MPTQTVTTPTFKTKLAGLINEILKESKLPGAYQPVITAMVGNWLKTADEAEVRDILVKMKDQVIPWLLE